MPIRRANVRFEDQDGRLRAIQVCRASSRPIVSTLHGALLALGVIVTSYQVRPTTRGLEEHLEVSSQDGHEIAEDLSQSVRSAILPLAFDDDA